MTITDIIEISKEKSKIYIDNEFAFVLYKGEIRNYHIKKDEEITEGIYHIINDEVLPKRAKIRCLNLLKSRDYTRYQLETKLKQGYYAPEIIELALDYCESYHYIDDVRYARAYINYSMNRKSRKQIEQDLQIKGISKNDIGMAYGELDEDNETVKEEELIAKLLEKKRYKKSETSYEERQKLISFLFRKGFSLDKIYNVIDEKD